MSKVKVTITVQVAKNVDDSYGARLKSSLCNEQIVIKKADSLEEIMGRVQKMLEEADSQGKIGIKS